jgi:putative membrane protein
MTTSTSKLFLKRPHTMIEPIQPDAFISGAMMECMTDVQLAQLALARAISEPVRSFAIHLIEDCNRMLLEIARIATRTNLPVPKSLDAPHEHVLQRMREKTGSDFDSAYMERVALHHRQAITLFKRGQTISNPEISALASRMLATVEARIKMNRLFSGSVDQFLDGHGMTPPPSSADLGQTGQ